jgi:flavodoxin
VSAINVFYFSGTGNSLFVAKEIARQTNAISIPMISQLAKTSIDIDGEVLVLVFPIHYIWNGGIPLVVIKFIDKIRDLNKKQLYVVCTNGGGQGDSLLRLNKLLNKRNVKINAGYSITFPYNYINWAGTIEEYSDERIDEMISRCRNKIDNISISIMKRETEIIESDSKFILSIIDRPDLRIKLGKPHYQKWAKIDTKNDIPFTVILPLMDKSFISESKCNGCGICT